MKLRTEILIYLKGLFALYVLLFLMVGCLEKKPKKKQLEPPVLEDTIIYNEFQGKFISQKKINDSTYEIKAKANDTAKTMVFLSELPVNKRLLNENDSSILILKYNIEEDPITNKTIFRVKSVGVFW